MARETLTAEKNIVAWIATAVLDDIDPREGDAAWRAYTPRPDAPAKYKDIPKPA